MIGESIGIAIEKAAETAITASEVAELGAIKPNGFGSLIKERFTSEITQQQIDGLYVSEFPQLNTQLNLFGPRIIEENPYFSLRYNDISKDCSEYLCDYGITPWAWKEATIEQKMDMLGKTTEIIGKELNLPEEWIRDIKPIAVSGEDYIAQASCRVYPLSNGGVEIVGTPSLKVNINYLTDDYLEAMATVYHEMIHMKQYASIDCVAPGLTTDTRLLDLIKDLKANTGTPKTRVSYLHSPYEAEAWAQESYFKVMLEAVIRERYT